MWAMKMRKLLFWYLGHAHMVGEERKTLAETLAATLGVKP
jgi:hypothetical protein